MTFSCLSFKPSFTTHYINPLPKYPPRNHNYKVWSKIREQDQENSLGDAWNNRLVAGVSSSSSGVGVTKASWIDLYLPKGARGYAKLARMDKSFGPWLVAWPYMWSVALAAEPGSLPSFEMMTLLVCKAFFLRGAGCTINDLFDRDIDKKVERTRLRPLASGLLTQFQGLQFLGLQLLLVLGILFQLNNYSRVLGALSLLLIFFYPLTKRFTYWPQAFFGFTVNWAALIGWAAVKGSLEPYVVLPLYLSGVCWTIVYDTIYAHQDKEDDVKVGVKSTAITVIRRSFGSLDLAQHPWCCLHFLD